MFRKQLLYVLTLMTLLMVAIGQGCYFEVATMDILSLDSAEHTDLKTSPHPEDRILQLTQKFSPENYHKFFGKSLYTGRINSDSSIQAEYHVVFEPPFDRALSRLHTRNSHPIGHSIIGFIDNVPKGSTIRLSFYHFTNRHYTAALVNAIQRGVDVQVILSNSQKISEQSRQDSPGSNRGREAMDSILEAQHDNPSEGHFFQVCEKGSGAGGCIGSGKNHNKFFTLSSVCRFGLDEDGMCKEVEGEVHIFTSAVLQTSKNLTYDALHSYDTLSVFLGERHLYDTYVDYFNLMKEMSQAPAANGLNISRRMNVTLNGVFEFHALPRPISTVGERVPLRIDNRDIELIEPEVGDVVINELEKVQCINELGQKTQIRIANAHWTDSSRGRSIINALKNLHEKECEIQVLGARSLSPGGARSATYQRLLNAGIDVKPYYSTINTDASIHAKIVMIDYKDSQELKNVLMFGSMSFTNPSHTSNDEVWNIWRNPFLEVFRFYTDSFDSMTSAIH